MASTRFSNYSDIQLNFLFSTEIWNQLPGDYRLDAYTEVVNRYTTHHNLPDFEVKEDNLEGGIVGYQSGESVTVNSNLLRDGKIRTHTQDGTVLEMDIEGSNWLLLANAVHEMTHGKDYIEGVIDGDYITPEIDRDLYRIQGEEKRANAAGEAYALKAIDDYKRATGTEDPNAENYKSLIEAKSFNSARKRAAIKYGDPDIENTLNEVKMYRYYNVDKEDPSPSYISINNAIDSYQNNVNRNSMDNGQYSADTGQTGASQSEQTSATSSQGTDNAQLEADMQNSYNTRSNSNGMGY